MGEAGSLAAPLPPAGAVRRPAVSAGGGTAVRRQALTATRQMRSVGQCNSVTSPLPWPRPTARPSPRASIALASCRARPMRFRWRKAPLEFLVGRAQRRLRIGIEVAGEIDHREQQIADLGCGRIASAGLDIGLDLVGLLADLGQHRQRIVPVEADLAGLLLQLQRARQGREVHRHARQRAGAAALPLPLSPRS